MKITGVNAIILRLPVVTADVDGTQDDVIIQVTTDSGLSGYGEADSSPEVVKAIIEAPRSHGICAGLRQLLVGRDPLDIQSLWRAMYEGTLYMGRQGAALHALSGVDIALWDLKGKALGKPVHELLGGTHRRKLRAYASMLMPGTPAEAERAARTAVDQGFTAMKMGWGPLGKDLDYDIELVRAARRGAGEADIMIDAGEAYDVATALRAGRAFNDLGVKWLEEPLGPDDLEGYRQLADELEIPVATGEEDSTLRVFERLIDQGHVDIIQPDISRAGGITEARKIALMAHSRGRRCVFHSFKSGILLSSCLHVACSVPAIDLLEYSVAASPLRHDLVKPRFEAHGGYVDLPDRPGLGFELNEETVAKYRVRHSEDRAEVQVAR